VLLVVLLRHLRPRRGASARLTTQVRAPSHQVCGISSARKRRARMWRGPRLESPAEEVVLHVPELGTKARLDRVDEGSHKLAVALLKPRDDLLVLLHLLKF
jgi:hypothetical protein